MNQFWVKQPLTPDCLCRRHRLRMAQFSEPIQNGGPDMQLIDPSLECA